MAGYRWKGSEPPEPLPIEPAPPETGPKCGTRAGYRVHRANDEAACDECRVANTAYSTDWDRRKNKRRIRTGFTTDQCGTMPGYSSHRRHKIPICDACRAACKEYNKRRYLKKTAA